MSKNPNSEMGLRDRLRNRLSFESKKNSSDFKNFNPVSPDSTLNLRTSSVGNGGPIPTPPSSSSSSSDSVSERTGNPPCLRRSDRGGGNNSGELSVSSENSPNAVDSIRSIASTPNFNSGHRRSSSGSTPLIYSSRSVGSKGSGGGGGGGIGGSVNSRIVNVLPTGNICPSGKILTTGMAARNAPRSGVLGSGTGNYGHGSIMPGAVGGKTSGGGSSSRVGNEGGGSIRCGGGGGGGGGGRGSDVSKALTSWDIEVVKEAGNDQYKRGRFMEALSLYNRAITISPSNAVCRSNKAAALTGLGRLAEAVKECEEAVRLDPKYARVHQRLASLHLRLGQVENARKHFCFAGQQPDSVELKKLQEVEKHLDRCFGVRSIGDWECVLKEANAAIVLGADSSPQLFACRVEALLKLHRFVEANSGLSDIPKFEPYPNSCSKTKFFGMLSEAYVLHVRAQVEMALGRFENAVTAAEKAERIDPSSLEVSKMLHNVRLVKRARDRGNGLLNDHKFLEAASAYGEGLKYDPSNSVLHCNRATCWSNLGQWEKIVEECNNVLRTHPTYTKALQQRAHAYGKLERWAESLRDYELLRKESPGDNEVAEAQLQAQVALKKLRAEEVQNLKSGGKVEEVSDLKHFRDAIASSGISVVYFKATANQQCEQISPFVDMLSIRYSSVRFLKVDMEESLGIAKAVNVRTEVPAFKIYENGSKVMEMIRPSRNVLESSVKEYSL